MSKKIQEYKTYFTPEFIYIPYDAVNLLNINKNKKVYYNMFMGTTKNGDKLYSPVSGKLIGTCEMNYKSGIKNALVIENDFMDKREKLNYARNINKLKKSEIIESLEKYGLNKKINSKTILVVNSYYDKKYDLKDMVINYESYEQLLEAIDEFMNIFNMKTCYISINDRDLISISAFEKYINAFPNICLVQSNKKFKDSICVFYNIEEILAIYKAIHLDYMYDNTIITINDGEAKIVKVKIYSSLFEILKALKITSRGKKIYVDNQLIEHSKSFIIDSSVRSVVIKD